MSLGVIISLFVTKLEWLLILEADYGCLSSITTDLDSRHSCGVKV
jgi:hypothetical protein